MQPSFDFHHEEFRDLWEDTIRKFERAWLDGQYPRIEDFVPAEPVAARHVLPQLVMADLEFRLKGRDQARVEQYCLQFPQLRDFDTLEELLRTEFQWRSQLEHLDPVVEYGGRFPEMKDRVAAWAQAADNLPPTLFNVRGIEVGPPGHVPPQSQEHTNCTPAEMDSRLSLDVFGAAADSLQDFTFRYMLGSGGMGVVYLAQQISLQRPVAIKVLAESALQDVEARTRFQREAVVMGRLQHPNIVQVYSTGEAMGRLYYIMEYMPGGNLGERIRGERLSLAVAALTVEKLAHALHAAHEQELIHRDIKPANILLTSDGTPKLSDFGLVKRLDHQQDTIIPSPLMGTPAYMSPEQASGRPGALSRASDIYSLGAILYELITGQPPITGDGLLEVLENLKTLEPRRPRALVPSLPQALEVVCLKCLRKLPEDRYATALDLAEDLARYRTGHAVHAGRRGTLQFLRYRWPPRAIKGGIVVLLVLIMALGAMMFQPSHERGSSLVSEEQHVQEIRHVFLEAHNALNASLTKESALKATGRARAYYNSFLEQYRNDARFQTESALAQYGLGRIARFEGDDLEAIRLWTHALELIPANNELTTDVDLQRLHCRVQIRLQLSLLHVRRKDYAAGAAALSDLRAILEKQFSRYRENVSVQYALGLCYSRHAILMGKGLEPKDVLPLCQQACELFQDLHDKQGPPPFGGAPNPERYRSCLTEALVRRGAALAELEEHGTAKRDFESAMNHAETVLAAGEIADPNDDATSQKWSELVRDAKHGLARSCYMIGKKHLNDSHPELAGTEFEHAIRLWSDVTALKTATASQRFYFASSYFHLAIGQRRQGSHAAALVNYGRAAALWESLLAEKPSTNFNRQLTESHLAESRAEIAKLTVVLSLNTLLMPASGTPDSPSVP